MSDGIKNYILDTTGAETMEIDGPEWLISDLKTLDDCDDAQAFLTSAVASIEYQIEMDSIKPDGQQNREWAAKAKMALRYKKAAMQLLTYKRGKLGKDLERIEEARQDARHAARDASLLAYIRRAVTPKKFTEWLIASGHIDMN